VPTHNFRSLSCFFVLKLIYKSATTTTVLHFPSAQSVGHTSFLDDLKQSSLITNPPQPLNPLLDEYDTTFTVFSISMHPSLPNDLLATVLLSHGSRNPFVLLIAPVVKPNLPTDPHIPLQTILSSGVFAINTINLSLQPRELTTHSWSNPPMEHNK